MQISNLPLTLKFHPTYISYYTAIIIRSTIWHKWSFHDNKGFGRRGSQVITFLHEIIWTNFSEMVNKKLVLFNGYLCKAWTKKTGFNLIIVHFYIHKKLYNMILYIIFPYGWEPVLIHWIQNTIFINLGLPILTWHWRNTQITCNTCYLEMKMGPTSATSWQWDQTCIR